MANWGERLSAILLRDRARLPRNELGPKSKKYNFLYRAKEHKQLWFSFPTLITIAIVCHFHDPTLISPPPLSSSSSASSLT